MQPPLYLYSSRLEGANLSSRSGSPSPSGQSTSSSDDDVLNKALEFVTHPPPEYTSIPRLAKPVAVPQMSNGIGMPYSRAWPPALLDHGISMEEFVELIDNLNIVSTGSPPLKVVDAVGGTLGMVPYYWFNLAGMLTQAAAKMGTAAVSKGRTDRFMKRANEESFGPRRLKVEIETIGALGVVLGLTKEQIDDGAKA